MIMQGVDFSEHIERQGFDGSSFICFIALAFATMKSRCFDR